MTDIELYVWFVAGILLSTLVPVAVKWIKEVSDTTSHGFGDQLAKVWHFAKPYFRAMLGSMVLGLLILALYRSGQGGQAGIKHWATALIYGYSWDSTVQKISLTK
ncbi:hypothetical protein [Nostoc favosum]|uniref:Uncharacterized protein n=1 Tax=Nostoc favosum CHAB5714 TaxID=2780399 RepID=A0ABS8I997_9NOSO|nr:hypothetical protein [Nostoc favosum]MCC5600632.1 hypothetical protein [Nostoc favosum CHAB5714]